MSHITIAASANAFRQLFIAVRSNFTFSRSDTVNFGPFSASYSVVAHLEGGTIQLNDDNTIEIQDIDLVFNTLMLTLCFDLPAYCTPGFCIVPDPWNGCLVGVPQFCIGGPICAPLNLSGLVSEISDIKANLVARYFVDPTRDPSWSDLTAEFNGKSNKWQVFINPVSVLINPIDVPATVGNLLENAVKNAINNFLPWWLPDWAKDLIFGFLGPILALVKDILGIVGEVSEFISDLLGNQLGLLGLIETAIADYFANRTPIYEFEDPYPVLTGGGLIPVKIPIRNLGAAVNSKEMVILADVGA